MIGCFNHRPFNCIASKTMDSTFFKTKDNKVCDRRNNFVNHLFCIILSPPKNFAFYVRWKSFDNLGKRRSKMDKMWTKKVQNSVICSRTATVNHEKFKILCWVSTSLLPAPQTFLPHTHIQKNKHNHSLPTNPQSPLETVLMPLHRVFQSLLQIMFVIN